MQTRIVRWAQMNISLSNISQIVFLAERYHLIVRIISSTLELGQLKHAVPYPIPEIPQGLFLRGKWEEIPLCVTDIYIIGIAYYTEL